MTKKICISGYYGFGNFGDETILKILVENLKKFEIPPQITVFSVNPPKTASDLGVKSVNTFKVTDIVKTIFTSDCLISGGGSLLQDVTSRKSLIYYLFVIMLGWVFRKKIIIFAQGIGPLNNFLLRKLTVFLLKKAAFITVRDDNSFNFLENNKIKNFEKCSDPVWNINLPETEKTQKIGIQLRSFPSINDDFLEELANNTEKYYADKEILVLSLQNQQDLELCEKFRTVLLRKNQNIKVKVIENTSNDKVIENICSLNTLIAMRYHACLVAIKAGVKVLPINYDIKVEALSKEFEINYINLEEDMSKTFADFVQNSATYNEEKINSLKFDFSKLGKFLN